MENYGLNYYFGVLDISRKWVIIGIECYYCEIWELMVGLVCILLFCGSGCSVIEIRYWNFIF